MGSEIASSQTIFWLIICCVAFIIMLFFSKPIKLLVRIIIGGILGALGMYIFNIILAPFGIYVGVNLLTMLIVGILGFPGFITLYISSILL